ncbi:Fic family protein [Deinococcus sp. SM5_A1]|uniref:Fic family protein n=1 Tax=Deinococcus sp. SM5_A1 TaxID=3379094 RepID=UPI0038584409
MASDNSNSTGRAGRYVKQGSGYRAFIPAGLPPVPGIQTAALLGELLGAQEAVGRLDGIATTLPNVELLVFMYIRAEAVLSSQIEGTQASLDDVLRAEADLKAADDPRDVQEVMNYIAALDYGLKRTAELPLSLRLIREIHTRLMQGVRGDTRNPGEFRRTQNWIGPAGATLNTARFVPPPVPEMLSALDDLERFIYEDRSGVPNLIKIGLLHAQFETIHPFLDGNGRTGRLLITLLLCHYGLLTQPLLYLSYYFKVHRTEYYDRLQAVRDRGDWEGWLRFYLMGVRTVALESTEKTRAVLRLRQLDRDRLADLGTRSGRALRLVDHLYRFPYVTIRAVQKLSGLSYNTASALVNDLVEVGVLVPLDERQRDRVYYHKAYVDIFQIESPVLGGSPEDVTGSVGGGS